MSTTPLTIVLVHGSWHGSWCWKFQIPALEALGYAVKAVDLPSTGVAGKTISDDVAHLRSVIESITTAGKRVVVLAHSYGGPVANAAIRDLSEIDGVLGLINLCAFIYPGGVDQGAVIRSLGDLPFVAWDSPSEGLWVLKDNRDRLYPPDTPPDRVDWALPQLHPHSSAANLCIVPPQAWQDDRYTNRLGYIRCTDDLAVPVAQQDSMLEAAGGQGKWIVRTLEGSGHSPFLSRPDEVAAAVDEIVKEFEARL